MKKYSMSQFPAYEVVVEMEGDLQAYALNFLKIFNTVKSNRELICISNNYHNAVQVVCEKEALEATKDYLSNFGEVTGVNKVLCAKLEEDIEYDYDEYDELVLVPYID